MKSFFNPRVARVFPRRLSQTPDDCNAYCGPPPLLCPMYDEVRISVTFTWDKPLAMLLAKQWEHVGEIKIGGPAYDDNGDVFVAGQYLKRGYTITSRGCPNRCWFCMVPAREGKIRELPIVEGRFVQDNNLTACSWGHIESVFNMLKNQKQVEFSGGLESARINDRWIELLRGISLSQLFLAFDDSSRDMVTKKALEKLSKAGFHRRKLRCFVLSGYDGDTIEKAINRCRLVWEWGGMPFMMLYRDENDSIVYTKEWKNTQRLWCRPALIKYMIRKEIATI